MTIEDIKTLESLFIVEMHSAERIFRLIETGMETIYRESKDYKALIERKNDLRRLTKGKPQDKIDPIAGLVNCTYLFDLANGNIQQ